jgi:hypothetical protein
MDGYHARRAHELAQVEARRIAGASGEVQRRIDVGAGVGTQVQLRYVGGIAAVLA